MLNSVGLNKRSRLAVIPAKRLFEEPGIYLVEIQYDSENNLNFVHFYCRKDYRLIRFCAKNIKKH